MELDGLLTALTPTCWVARGEPVTPEARAHALARPPVTSVAFSHSTAFWVWWGEGPAPGLLSVSATRRKRMRSYKDDWVFHEGIVAPEHVIDVEGVRVTSQAWTLMDMLSELCETAYQDDATIAKARSILERVPADARFAFVDMIVGLYRKPKIARIKSLSAKADPLLANRLRTHQYLR